MSELLNTVVYLAAPRLYVKFPDPGTLKQRALGRIRKFITLLYPSRTRRWTKAPLIRLAMAARKLRMRLGSWDPAEGLSPEIMAQARSCLSAVGIPEPPVGWDSFDGGPKA